MPRKSGLIYHLICLWSPYGIEQTIIIIFVLWFLPSFFSSPNVSHRRCLPYFHTRCGLSANLGCRSETCCTRLADKAGSKKPPKMRHLGTIAQLCRAISSQLRQVSTIEKNLLSSNMSSRCPHNVVNFGLLAAEICWQV